MGKKIDNKDMKVELRSEEVQEIMGKIPPWILRWGIAILFLVVFILLIGSILFKYPDVISTEMTLTGQSPVVPIVARSTGKISTLYTGEGEEVSTNTLLAVLENSASTEDVFRIKNLLSNAIPDDIINPITDKRNYSLGDIQPAYSAFLNSVNEYGNYRRINYYPQKIASTRRQIDKYNTYYAKLFSQQEVMISQYTIASQQYERDSLLYARSVISPSEHETARSNWLQSRYNLEGANASLENLKIQIGQLEETLLDLELQQAEKESVLLQNRQTAKESLMNAVNNWELSYCLISPIEGRVTFNSYWNENQHVKTGETVFTIVPQTEEKLVGKSLLPIQRSGKVKTGQRVIVRFANYPDQEFGIVNGVVASISMVPSDNNYTVEVQFPEGLVTNYGFVLPLSHEMVAMAEIVTEDLRLIERFFMPLKRVWKEGFE